ncbi:hypothetical protein BH20ACT9_BH20ACT9_12060 [soil metagenome]
MVGDTFPNTSVRRAHRMARVLLIAAVSSKCVEYHDDVRAELGLP